jgi:diguanylate cyclase (GGDEF)-like protein
LRSHFPLVLAGALLAGAAFNRRLRRLESECQALQDVADSLNARNAQLGALSNVFSQIAADMSFDRVVNISLRETARIMKADMVSLRRLEGDRLVSVGAMLQDGSSIALTSEMRVGAGLTGVAVKEMRTVRVDHDAEQMMAPQEPDDSTSPSEQSSSPPQQSGVVAPLIVGSQAVGALAVWSREPEHFTAEDETVLEMMASQVSTAMVASLVMEERDRIAHLDALTGLPNRLQLAEDLVGKIAALPGLGRSAVFAMADIDNFKGFNDQLGHNAGDIALQNVGAVLRGTIRPRDHIYRYGGEEFLVIFMDADIAKGVGLAERLRIAIENQIQGVRPVTVSIGLAALPQDGLEPSRLIELADRALYRAKRTGRNRTAVWSSTPERSSAA